jgi:hypothetical protein
MLLLCLYISCFFHLANTACHERNYVSIFGSNSSDEISNIEYVTQAIEYDLLIIAVAGKLEINSSPVAFAYTFDYANCSLLSSYYWSNFGYTGIRAI